MRVEETPAIPWMNLTFARTAEQSEGGKTVGVDSTVITARRSLQQCLG